jgi:hypothetical protein
MNLKVFFEMSGKAGFATHQAKFNSLSLALSRDRGFVVSDKMPSTTRVGENDRFGEGDIIGLLAWVTHSQAALCLSDRSLHRFDQTIHFLSR